MRLIAFCLLFFAFCYSYDDVRSYEIAGSGESISLDEARTLAKQDIAQKIKTKVTSWFESNVSVSNDFVQSLKKAYLKESSNISFYGLRKISEEKIGNTYKVVYAYDLRSYEQKFASNVGILACNKTSKDDTFLENSPLFTSIGELLNCKPYGLLSRNNDAYFLSSKDYSYVLDDSAIYELFYEINNPKIVLLPSSSAVQNGKSISFAITANEQGFVSLFDVYGNGKVSVLLANKEVKNSSKFTFPSKNSSDEIVKIKDEDSVYDMEVAILSDKKLDLSMFEGINSNLASKNAYRLDLLLKIMSKYPHSTVVVKILDN